MRVRAPSAAVRSQTRIGPPMSIHNATTAATEGSRRRRRRTFCSAPPLACDRRNERHVRLDGLERGTYLAGLLVALRGILGQAAQDDRARIGGTAG